MSVWLRFRPPKPETPLDLTTKRSTPSNSPPPLVINSEAEDDDAEDDDSHSGRSSPPVLSIRPAAAVAAAVSATDVKLASDAAKAQFEAMIHDKLVSANTLFSLFFMPSESHTIRENTFLYMGDFQRCCL